MKAIYLYQQLEKDFIKPELSDEWAEHMSSVADFLCENFKQRSMGLVCDFATEINKVYTAVFPSKKVMQNILDRGETDLILFVHHPSIWDIRKAPEAFQQMDRNLLTQFKERKISIYNLHVPLDNYGEYSTSVSLAKALGIKPEKSFAPYFGALCGIIGQTGLKTVSELKEKLETVIGHTSSLYNHGEEKIKDGMISVIAGGGNSVEMLEEVVKEGINTFVTGITVKNEHSQKAHEFAEQNKINILGGTHYSTEKFACMAMCKYFEKIGLSAEFIADEPVIEDI
ncbi:MAG: Nif3-like dinuclear metal center hexameric protein [Lutibacter sp.]|jgi:putative NIF3 family GTP cyclohydrolase 1 type 2